jgi:hypothetical protein
MKKTFLAAILTILLVSQSFAQPLGPGGIYGIPKALTLDSLTLNGLTASLPLSLNASKVMETLTIANFRTLLGLGTGDSPTFKIATLTDLTPTYLPLAGTGGLLGNSAIIQDASGGVQVPEISVSTKTDSYVILITDFGKSLRMNSADAEIFTLPSVDATNDGAKVTLIKIGAGNLTIQAADSDKIADSSAGGTILNSTAAQTWATITLEYCDATVTWNVIGAHGTWTTT